MSQDQHTPEQGPSEALSASESASDPRVGVSRRTEALSGPQTGAESLRQRIAEALMSWAEGNNAPKYASIRRPETVTKNAYARADAVLAAVQPELDRLRRLAIDRADRIDDINFARASLRTRLAEQEEETMRQHERARNVEAAVARVQDAAALHRKQLLSTPELYAVIEAALQPPAPAHDGPSVAECRDNDRRWPLEKEGL